MSYEVLYSFADKNYGLFEIKFNDLPENAPKSRVYHWVFVDLKENNFRRLTFVSMDNNLRNFKEGLIEMYEDYVILALYKNTNSLIDFGSEYYNLSDCKVYDFDISDHIETYANYQRMEN